MNPEEDTKYRRLQKFQNLSGSQYSLLRTLIDEGLTNESEIEGIIEQIVQDRIKLAQDKISFARNLTSKTDEIANKTVINVVYYAMYQVGRAVVFHTRRSDVDSHERIAFEVGEIVNEKCGQILNYWRRIRNEVDYSPYPDVEDSVEVIARRGIDEGIELIDVCTDFLRKRGAKV